MPRIATLGVAILLELIVSATITSAAPIVIDFEDLSDRVVVNHQYDEKGIIFNEPAVFDYSKNVEPSRFQGFTHSGTKAIEQCYPGREFCTTPIQMAFTAPQKHVKVWVGYSRLGSFTEKKTVIMRAFDITGALIKETTAAFQPGTGPILVKIPMEIVSDSANIVNVTLNLATDTINPTTTNNLVVDDVEFDTSGPALPCHATQNPVVRISNPTDGQVVRTNIFDLQGTIDTTAQLNSATLTITGSGGSKSLDVLLTNYPLHNGGPYSVNGITDMLFLGSNTITVSAQNCKGSGENSIKLTYEPCDRELKPVVTITEPITSDIAVLSPPRLKGNINPAANIENVRVIISAGPPIINAGFKYFDIQPDDRGAFDYQLKWEDLFQGGQNIIEVVAHSSNGCSGRAETRIVFIKNYATKLIKGRILYEDATPDGKTSQGFKPARFCNFNLILNYEGGGYDIPCVTDNNGTFTYVAQTITGEGLIKSAEVILGTDIDEYHVNRAVRISKDLEYCNEYVWWNSDTKTAWIGKDLNFGDLRIGKDQDLEFTGHWQEHEHSWGICGGPIHSLPGGSVYFNVADVILYAREYADDQRAKAHEGGYDQGADDNIGEVAVTWEGWSHYDSIWGEIHLLPEHGFDDATIVHEYGHYLEEAISTINNDPRGHSECDATYLEFAWKEGFPEYYADIVPYHYNLSNMGTQNIEDNFCQNPSETVEGTVEGVLWDIVDRPGQHFPEPNGALITKDETFDKLSGNEDMVFSIFDYEMDNDADVDICTFVNKGWLGNRLPLSRQDKDAIKPICKQFNIGCVQYE